MTIPQGETVAAVPVPAPFMGLVDKLGRAFDAEKFRIGDDGKPRLDSIGRFVNRHGGAPKKAVPVPAPAADFSDVKNVLQGGAHDLRGAGIAPGEHEPGELIPLPIDSYTEAAAGIVAGMSTAAILLMGTHVAPTSEQSIAMVKAYADAFRAYGYRPEVPPWLPPLVATSVWIGPHFSDVRSQTRLQAWKAKVAAGWQWLKRFVPARRAAAVAASVSVPAAP